MIITINKWGLLLAVAFCGFKAVAQSHEKNNDILHNAVHHGDERNGTE